MLRELSEQEKSNLSLIIFSGENEEQGRDNIRIENGSMIIEKDNQDGFMTIIEQNGSIRVLCKDNNEDYSHTAKVSAILKYLHSIGINLISY